jgi:hypothetical protein
MSAAQRQKPAPGELFLDHVSHFVPDLDAAAELLERLGFVVTALSKQIANGEPVGASNRCVMLEEGYLELLTPTHDTPAAQRMRASMQRFTGVHLACFGTPDAQAEHARLAAHGFEPQPLVDLERRVDGGDTVRFKVVRPALDKMPEGRVQYVQHMKPEAIWTEANLGHRNEVTGLKALCVVADDVARTAARWARFTAMLPRHEDGRVILQAARGRVLFEEGPAAPALAGYALSCRHPEAFAARCSGLGLAVRRAHAGYAVSLPPSLGGEWLI